MAALELLTDLALLSSLSALAHFFFGLSGVLAAALGVSLLEHGAQLAASARGWRLVPHAETPALGPAPSPDASSSNSSSSSSGDNGDGDSPDPRTLLEQFATSDVTYDFDVPAAPLSSAASEVSAASSDDASARLVIRDVGSVRSEPGDALVLMNARAPIAFETELFAGCVHFFVRTAPEDPHWAHLFRGRRRMFWIQVQGRFKRAPRGTVYLGGELPAQIAPGLFTRSVALVIMGLIQQLVGSVNFSFGDADSDVVPSIALPLYQSADQLIVTPAGEQPPPLGERDFGETEAARRQRRATPVGSEVYEVGATYSFDFHTMYVDLTRWRTANLPGLSEMELSTFFDSLPLRMVAYDVRASPSERHRQQQKQYLFSFEVQYDRHRGSHTLQHPHQSSSAAGTRREQSPPLQGGLERHESDNSEEAQSLAGVGSTDGMSTVVSDASSSFDEQTLVLDEVLFLNQERARRLTALSVVYLCWLEEVDVPTGVRRVHYVFSLRDASSGDTQQIAVVSAYELRLLLLGRRRTKGNNRMSSKHHHHRRNQQQLPRSSSSKDVGSEDGLLSLDALRFHSQSRIGSYSTISDEALVIADCVEKLVKSSSTTGGESVASSDNGNADSGDGTTAASNASEEDHFPAELRASPTPLDLLNENEEIAFQAALYQCLTRRSQLQVAQSSTALSLTPSMLGVNLSKRERDEMRVVFEGVVYRYYTEALLRQEVLVVTVDELLFYRSYSASPEKRVACSHVIGVRALPSLPFMLEGTAESEPVDSGTCVLQITTLAEEIVLCVSTEHARSVWLRVLVQHCEPQTNVERSQSHSLMVAQICCATNKPLKPAGRIILNSRSLFPRHSTSLSSTAPVDGSVSTTSSPAGERAIHMVERALKLGLRIHRHGSERVSASETLEFMDAASSLRSLDLRAAQRDLAHEAQMALFLNLYHVVLAHAMLAHGFPRSKSQWATFLTHMCYSVGLDASGREQASLSLAEIEHLLLRRRMQQADLPYLSVSSLLSGRESSLSLQLRRRCLEGIGVSHPDFRLTFALATNQQLCNRRESGSDQRGLVAVYKPERVHDQLNAVASSVLRGSVSVEKRKDGSAVIFLPRICEWYRLDFGGGGSPLHCARRLLGFVDESVQHEVMEVLEDPLATRTKFCDFKFTPKTALVQVLDETEAEQVDAGGSEPDEMLRRRYHQQQQVDPNA